MVFAIAAGSLACTKAGAQPSLPSASDIAELAGGIMPFRFA